MGSRAKTHCWLAGWLAKPDLVPAESTESNNFYAQR